MVINIEDRVFLYKAIMRRKYMFCKKCGMENSETAMFCVGCGAPLKEEAAAEEVSTAEDTAPATSDTEEEFDEEESTAVLTSDMAPKKDDGVDTPTEVMAAEPEKAETDNPTETMTDEGMQKTEEVTAEAEQPSDKKAGKEKKEKKKKEKTEKKQGMSTGNKVYLAVSIVVMVALAGFGTYFYIDKEKKIEDLNSQIELINKEKDQQKIDLEGKLAGKDEEIKNLTNDVDNKNDQIALYEEDIKNYEASTEEYSQFDALIKFAKKATGQAYSGFFCSDTVIHLKERTAVKVYFAHAAGDEESSVNYETENKNIAACEWGEGWENNDVATLYITPGSQKGNTTITLSNSSSDDKIKIYVYVD